MYSNIYFDRFKSEIHYWEYENNKKEHKVAPAPLYFFVEGSENEEECFYKTIFGKPARKLEYTRWGQYKNDKEKYKQWGRKLFESDVPIETKFIIDNYDGINLKIPNIDIHYIDIEVHSDEGFPRASDAKFPITIITTWSTKHNKYFIFSEKDFDSSFITASSEKFIKKVFSKETDMLEYYSDFLVKEHPDILTGWSSNSYDIPYIMNRIKNLLGEEYLKKLSPVESVYERMVPITEYREEGRWNIGGIYTLDLLEIYKNYTFSEKESWKLDDVAFEEIGERKIEYDGTLADLYNNDWQKYVEYNIQDVRLLRKLEEKKKFIPLLITFCYGCRVPLDQYQKTTRVLDGAFISSLKSENIVLPDVNRDIGDTDYIGGFVMNPIKGLHDWIVSFDATSLYPSIMMNLNISPETKIGKIPDTSVKHVMSALSGKNINEDVFFCGEKFSCNDFVKFLKQGDYCLAGNGTIFRQDVQGIIPRFVEEWFNKRKEFKKKMLKALTQGNKKKADEYHNLQLNYKILINSVYGYLGTPHSRFFDKDNAIAVTMTARMITITAGKTVNHFFSSEKWNKINKWGRVIIELEDGKELELIDTDRVKVIRDGNENIIDAKELLETDDFIEVINNI